MAELEHRVSGEPLTLDDRRLLVELQSFGVRVVGGDDTLGRRGGAGPSDALEAARDGVAGDESRGEHDR